MPRRIDAELDPAPREKQAKEDAKISTTSVLYTSTGEHIISATSKGQLNLIDAATCEIIYSEKVSSGMITGVRLSRSGKEIVVNALDRIVRTFHVPTKLGPGVDPDTIRLPLEHKFQDVVNKLSWNHVTFSGTGEYVAASTYNNHELYIWERQHGSLVRMLEGPKEEQGPLEWHPHRPMLAACGLETGRIYIWSVATPQKWSALAPDFEEVEENVEYSENEDEFDRHPQEEIHKRRIDAEERGDVEVLAPNTTTAASASASALADAAAAAAFDDDDPVTTFSGAAGVFRMPVLFDLGESDSEEEFVAVSAGTMRRKSYGEGGGEEGGTENGYRAASVGVAADGGEGMAAGAGGGSGRATPTASANGASASAGRSAAAKKGSARSGARGKAKGKS